MAASLAASLSAHGRVRYAGVGPALGQQRVPAHSYLMESPPFALGHAAIIPSIKHRFPSDHRS